MKDTANNLLTLIRQGNAYKTFLARKEENIIHLGHIQYDFSIYDLVNKLGPDYDYKKNIELVRQKQIAELTLSEIATYFTWLMRSERFCDGLIASYIDNGTFAQLLVRLIDLC